MCGTVKIYDIYQDGRMREKDSRTGEIVFVEYEYAISKLDHMIDYYTNCAEKYKNAGNYHRMFTAKLELFKQMKHYVEEKK